MATRPIIYCGYTPEYTETQRLYYKDDKLAGYAAGTWTATWTIPARAVITDIILCGVALWNAGTTAVLDVGDADDPDGWFSQVDLKGSELSVDAAVNFSHSGNVEGAYLTSADTASAATTNRYSASEKTITATITTVGTAVSTGETIITVKYAFEPAGAGGMKGSTYLAT